METANIKQAETQERNQLDFDDLLGRLYPMSNHQLYGSPQTFLETDFLMPETLAEFTKNGTCDVKVTNLEMCPACFFQTSGTTSRSKRIPYSDSDLDRQKEHEAIALRKLGMTEHDFVISLGAPMPSISGWAITNGSQAVGATVLNTSQLDYDDVLADPAQAASATFVIGTPIVVKEIGKDIRETYGAVENVLPKLRTAVIFGDVLPDSLREEIKEIWGFQHIYSLYGTVEADVVATECTARLGQLELMQERLIFEIIPEEELKKERMDSSYKPKSININDAPHGTIGEILISDVAREILPLIRYRIGDVIKVFRGTAAYNTDKPSISVLGRSKNAVYFGDTPVYEMQINHAVTTAFNNDVLDWRLIQVAKPCAYKLQILADSPDQAAQRDKILALLKQERRELADIDLHQHIEVECVAAFERAEIKGDTKAQRIQLMA